MQEMEILQQAVEAMTAEHNAVLSLSTAAAAQQASTAAFQNLVRQSRLAMLTELQHQHCRYLPRKWSCSLAHNAQAI